jgi:kumamolisin
MSRRSATLCDPHPQNIGSAGVSFEPNDMSGIFTAHYCPVRAPETRSNLCRSGCASREPQARPHGTDVHFLVRQDDDDPVFHVNDDAQSVGLGDRVSNLKRPGAVRGSVRPSSATAQSTWLARLRLNPGYAVLTGPQARVHIVNPPSGLVQGPNFARTNVKIAVPQGGLPQVQPNVVGPPVSGYLFETPASLACVYGLVARTNGCNPNLVFNNSSGGSRGIAIVDAYDYGKSQAVADVAAYTAQFGLPTANLTVVYGTGVPAAGCLDGSQPATSSGTGWDVEAALDMEMAVAMAPGAHIYLVEANSNSNSDLFNAVQVAAACVRAAGGGQLSMSWGINFELSGETASDSVFTGANVTYFAAAGDNPGVSYPAASPNVIGVGGTTYVRDLNGNFLQEIVWNDNYAGIGTGGGPSLYEPRPAYENFISSIVGNARGTPDVAALADPNTGVYVYNTSTFGGWGAVGGTSLATPLFAAMFNKFGLFFGSSFGALANNLYPFGQSGNIDTVFTNINSGACGPPGIDFSKKGLPTPYPNSATPPFSPQNTKALTGIPWNFCSGWGSIKNAGKPNVIVER